MIADKLEAKKKNKTVVYIESFCSKEMYVIDVFIQMIIHINKHRYLVIMVNIFQYMVGQSKQKIK